MSFNAKRLMAMLTQNYICPECGAKMEWEDEHEDSLVCLQCGNSMDPECYGYDSEEECLEAEYPSKEYILGYSEDNEDDESGEYYDPEYDE